MLISVLITCHNRKEKTLNSLYLLFKQNGINKNFIIEVFLVDDGCTDGTAALVNEQFPEVNIINGTGNLYWNGGMHLAWVTAAKTKKYDYYLWLNDDTFLFENALMELLSYTNNEAIICGSTKSEKCHIFSYGGYIDNIHIVPNGQFQQCNYSNGNILLISRQIFEKNGNLDPIFKHALGDFDYTLRAKKLGIEIVVAPNWLGFCENHKDEPKWVSGNIIFNRLKNLYTPLSGCSPNEFFVFDKRHNGLLFAVLHFISIHLRCFSPNLYKILKLKR